ncbi:enhanced serine sensitivity protein SseB C-terminal domain-containing protein [Yinghuangia seranimata]|uniref:enhanced serine sensitivity protein SseB C-terminal domain-containing protein n=1 Tax=Yinghuangia seranimata TaxID=408067 RepID=UPI00248B06A5|nr:enhanced serine sensitivity protein SseB C-terminal domain-containing protein [Yinghuangia seranimata]MDI2129373.1 enhanced serine sensitivity protein SseB C-terminal domain-containing protein [Yinghuangia seranimata]
MAFPANEVEHALRQVAPQGYEAYERLLEGLSRGHVWMLLWQGEPGSPDAQYGNMEVHGAHYAPCFTSEEQLRESGWDRGWEVHAVMEIAGTLYPDKWGLWLNPHMQGGGVGVPYLDLRRIVGGLEHLMPGPLRVGEPALDDQAFWTLLAGELGRSGVVRAAHRAYVEPALGPPRLVIGIRLADNDPATVDRMKAAMGRASAALQGISMSSVALDDPFDPVAAWMRDQTRPFL